MEEQAKTEDEKKIEFVYNKILKLTEKEPSHSCLQSDLWRAVYRKKDSNGNPLFESVADLKLFLDVLAKNNFIGMKETQNGNRKTAVITVTNQ